MKHFDPHARMRDLDSQFDIDLSEVDNIEFSDIDHNDAPDYCDACIVSADYKGREMTDGEIQDLQDNYSDWVYEKLIDYLN